MAIVIDASNIKKHSGPIYLQCKRKSEIIVNNVPQIDREQFFSELENEGIHIDDSCLNEDTDINFSFPTIIRGCAASLDYQYCFNKKTWKITIKIDSCVADSCYMSGKHNKLIPISIPEIICLKIAFLCPVSGKCIESMLTIDLGNTRSCALLCTDIYDVTRRGAIQIIKVPLFSYIDKKISDIGVCDSFVSFSQTDGASFTRIGKEAIPVSNILRGLKNSGDFYLSSPKRYFWDNDENINGWKLLSQQGDATTFNHNSTAKKLAEKFGLDLANNISRSAILASMLIEIIEQAENYLNNLNYRQESSLPNIISHICITFPAGWSEQERLKYRDVLQNALDVYQGNKWNISPKIVLDISCDEATAVLLCYIYGEIAKYSGYANAWLQAIGRTSPAGLGTHARIAVIDVGGGTSDLAIVDVQNEKSSNGLNLNINKLYKDGTDKAGDLLLHKVTEQILIKKIAAATISLSAPKNIKSTYLEQFANYLNNLSADSRVKQLSRRFWFPLAIRFIEAVNSGKDRVLLPDSKDILLEVIKDHQEEWTNNNVNEDDNYIGISDDDRKKFAKIVNMTFRESAKLFGAAIYAFDADLVILSGKTTETPQVCKVFQKYCYLPAKRFIPMWNYMIGNWCTISDAGRIKDSKYTTAIGAMIYGIANYHFPIQMLEASIKTQNAQGLNDGNSLWGIAQNGYFFSDDAILKPGKNECWVNFSGHPKLIARKRFAVDSSEVAISYELRFKPFKKRIKEWENHYKQNREDMLTKFKIALDSSDISCDDFLLSRKNTNDLRTPIIGVHIGFSDTDDSKSQLVINKLIGSYQNGDIIAKEDILLEPKPTKHSLNDSINVKLKLSVDYCERAIITISEVSGKYADGTPVMVDDLEMRIRNSGDELFWLDSGKI